jgi:hypothetical protein
MVGIQTTQPQQKKSRRGEEARRNERKKNPNRMDAFLPQVFPFTEGG